MHLFNKGKETFRYLGKDVWHLEKKKRVLLNDKYLQRLLEGVCGEKGSSIEKQDAELLQSYHLDHFNLKQRTELCKDSLFLFATKRDVKKHNMHCLKEINTSENPVAKIRALTMKGN